jgi:hypothetical protein
MTSLEPSALDHPLMKMAKASTWASIGVAAQDLRLEHRSRRPTRLRKEVTHESIIAEHVCN